MNQKFKKSITILVLLGCTFTSQVNAQTKDTENSKEEATKITRIKDQAQIMADKVTIKRESLATLDSMMLAEELTVEEMMFPADELYGIWHTTRVNPYEAENIAMPDSFTVDLADFVIPFEGRVTSKFGPRRRRMHYGTDIKVQTGDTVRAAFDGKVRVKYYQKRGYGYYLVLRHSNGLETVYGHLSKFLVDSDETIKAGQPIALGGNTGRSTGSHLHFEIRFLGQPINPADIVDFENFVTHTDTYTFYKKKVTSTNSYAKGNAAYHRVRQGDTLSGIAKRYGTTIKNLCKLNNITTSTVLKVGKSIRYS